MPPSTSTLSFTRRGLETARPRPLSCELKPPRPPTDRYRARARTSRRSASERSCRRAEHPGVDVDAEVEVGRAVGGVDVPVVRDFERPGEREAIPVDVVRRAVDVEVVLVVAELGVVVVEAPGFAGFERLLRSSSTPAPATAVANEHCSRYSVHSSLHGPRADARSNDKRREPERHASPFRDAWAPMRLSRRRDELLEALRCDVPVRVRAEAAVFARRTSRQPSCRP